MDFTPAVSQCVVMGTRVGFRVGPVYVSDSVKPGCFTGCLILIAIVVVGVGLLDGLYFLIRWLGTV